MADISQYTFSHKEVVEALIKKQGLHEGIWQLSVEFGIAAANIPTGQDQVSPAAIIPINKIGLLKVEVESSIATDAAKVNPLGK
jgi:hypothetical protein